VSSRENAFRVKNAPNPGQAARLPESFSTSSLRQFFDHLKTSYPTFPVRDWQGQNGIILRQDVDLDLGLAREFADIQAAAGLLSTFYVLLTSDCYNALSADSMAILRSLVNDGFEVGLHFDPTVDGDSERHLREAELLSRLSGAEVKSISLHNPASSGEFPLYKGFLNAYDPRIFASDRYLSDSRQGWRHDPWQFVRQASERTVQLLFHPCHYSPAGNGYEDAFAAHVDRYLRLVDASFRPFNDRYAAQIAPSLASWYRQAGERSVPDRTRAGDPE
jgi:hypothetical protein